MVFSGQLERERRAALVDPVAISSPKRPSRPKSTWLVINDYQRSGGTEKLVDELAAELRSFGDDVVCSAARETPGAQPGRAILGLNPAYALRVLRQLRSVRPDVVLIHNVYHEIGWLALPLVYRMAKRWNAACRVGYVLHDLSWRNPNACGLAYSGTTPRLVGQRSGWNAVFSKWDARRLASLAKVVRFLPTCLASPLRSCDVLIAPSAGMAEHVVESAPEVAPKVQVIENPARFDQMAPFRIPQNDHPSILLCSRLDPIKGIVEFVDSAPERSAIEVAGAGPLRAEIQARADIGRLTYLGMLDGPGVDQAMSRNDLLVIPTIGFENCPLSALEATKQGLPVAVPTTCGIASAVVERGWGFAFDVAGGFPAVLRGWQAFRANAADKPPPEPPSRYGQYLEELSALLGGVRSDGVPAGPADAEAQMEPGVRSGVVEPEVR